MIAVDVATLLITARLFLFVTVLALIVGTAMAWVARDCDYDPANAGNRLEAVVVQIENFIIRHFGPYR